MGAFVDSVKLGIALDQWRDSLINLSRGNKLLQYKKTKSSTLEISGLTPLEIFSRINSKTPTTVFGLKADTSAKDDSKDFTEVNSGSETGSVMPGASSKQNDLFAQVTQKEADATLKRISSAARREFMDKGLNTLYLALGSLSWVDDAEDRYVSPLILIPVLVESSSHRDKYEIRRSDDDIVSNPALILKMADYGLKLPSSEEVINAIEDGGIDAALALFKSIEIKDNWELGDLAAISVFVFQKEAMYRDLQDNENTILSNPIIQALSGGALDGKLSYYFDPVTQEELDNVAPPETTPLVLDADASQRAAVEAAVQGKSFVLDGPPGTGKSQTISNIIGALINEGKTVLFVSEKIVALEVVKDRLDRQGLGSFLFELHSAKSTRKQVAKDLGRALEVLPVSKPAMAQEELTEAKKLRLDLNGYAEAINEIKQPLAKSVFQALGELEVLNVGTASPPIDFPIQTLTTEQFLQIKDSAERIGRHWQTHLEGDGAVWSGLQDGQNLDFKVDSASAALSQLRAESDSCANDSNILGLSGLENVSKLVEVIRLWSSGTAFHDPAWLTANDLGAIAKSVDLLLENNSLTAASEASLASYLGNSWKTIQIEKIDSIVKEAPNLDRLYENWRESNVSSVPALSKKFESVASSVSRYVELVDSLSSDLGISKPSSLDQVQIFIEALEQLLKTKLPPVDWLVSSGSYESARTSVETLKACQIRLMEAESKASMFTSKVLTLNLDEYSDFFSVNKGFLKQLTSQYRTKKKSLLDCSKAEGWKNTLAVLGNAVVWQRSKVALNNAELIHSESLGTEYQGENTNWPEVLEKLEISRLITEGLEVLSISKFTQAINTKEAKAQISKTISSAKYMIWALADIEIDDHFSPELHPSDFDLSRLAALANDAVTEFGIFVQVTESNKVFLEDSTKLVSLLVGSLELKKYRELQDIASSLKENLSRLLGESLEFAFAGSTESIDHTQNKLTWTREFRALVNECRGTSKDLPISLDDFKAIERISSSAKYESVASNWLAAWSDLKNGFDDKSTLRLEKEAATFEAAAKLLQILKKALPDSDAWFDLARSVEVIERFGLTRVLKESVANDFDGAQVAAYVEKAVITNWIDEQIRQDSRLKEDSTLGRSHFIEQYRRLDSRLKAYSAGEIVRSASGRRPRNGDGQAGLIRREAEKKIKHIPVKELVDKSRDVIQKLHPCFMMSPLSVSQYLPSDIKFDVVIFDEASQVTPSEAINCIYRGNALITAGDQKQLPPMSFFAASGLDDEISGDDVSKDFDSILDLMKAAAAFNTMTLNWHYRSRHESLIAFSNMSFYENRLITYPGAIDLSDDLGVKFFRTEGVYRRSAGADNPIEAEEVVRRIINHFENRPGKTLGVVAFSTAQRDSIEHYLAKARLQRPDLDQFFDGGRQDGFFVNSLEAVQGDERDVIIFSIGYGPDENGKIYQNFGPLNRQGGERRLNVAITRAKQLVEIVSSMSASDLPNPSSEGARHLRKYLDFAERGPAALQLELGEAGLGTDSPFEDSVIAAVRSWGYDVQPQVGVAGYRIDIGVKSPSNPGAYMLGIECDGAMYHSSKTARDRDRLRHEILEGLGWEIYHIWGTAWYRHRERELEKLKAKLAAQEALPISGLLSKKIDTKSAEPVEVSFEQNSKLNYSKWTVEYVIAEVSATSTVIDLSRIDASKQLVAFVEEVVKIEEPIHVDLLLTRLRGRLAPQTNSRGLREKLEEAIDQSGIEREEDFLWISSSNGCFVRRAHPSESRDVTHIIDLEIQGAILKLVEDSTGITDRELAKALGEIFGWRRIVAKIEERISEEIDSLKKDGSIAIQGTGYKLK
jgi:very-short-patch-repair endonuclease